MNRLPIILGSLFMRLYIFYYYMTPLGARFVVTLVPLRHVELEKSYK